jgi:hypothetical protein
MGVTVSTTVSVDKLKEVLKKINSFETLEVLVGIPGNKNKRKKEKKVKIKEEITNSEIGFINEFGSPMRHIPPRPSLIPGVKKISAQLSTILKKHLQKFLEGKSQMESGLEEAGAKAASSVKNIIRTQENFVPLSENTILKRRNEGFEGESALIRTGQFYNSITYVVRKK